MHLFETIISIIVLTKAFENHNNNCNDQVRVDDNDDGHNYKIMLSIKFEDKKTL